MNKIGTIMIGFWILVILYQISSFSSHPSLPSISKTKLIKNYPPYLSNNSVILLIVDALRYDYHTQFKVIQRISSQRPSESFLVKCRVGSPTMTTQRIESMMTGSQSYQLFDVPTSFFASKVAKDNIIDQLRSNNHESMVLGDGTWIKLFSFDHHSTCNNSFDVHDFTTCDRHVYEGINSYLENNMKYSLLVGHFLALDHIGHSFSSIYTLQMRSKIIQISSFFEKLINQIDENTLLLIVGDHGMKSNGNHGGDSDEEKDTFLFGFKKNANFIKGYSEHVVAQSQIAATLSLYLNVPLPANTMGSPIIDSLPAELFDDPITLKDLYSNFQKHLNQILLYHQKTIISLSQFSFSKQGYTHLSSFVRSESMELFTQQNLVSQTVNKLIIFACLTNLIYLYSHIYKQKYKIIEKNEVKLYKTSFILLMIGVTVLFGSWSIIKISCTFLIIIIIVYLAIHLWSQEIHFYNIIIFSFWMFVLIQVQPQNQSEYSSNIFIIKIFQQIIFSLPAKIIILFIAIFNQFTNSFSHKNNNNFYWYFQFSLVLIQHYLKYCIEITIIEFRWFIIIISLMIFLVTKNTKILCCICLLFMRQHSILIYVCISIMINQIVRHNYSFIVGYLLSEMVWWVIGYRYEYSSILAADSFVLSSTFHPVLNGFSILLSQSAPLILTLCLLNEKYIQQKDMQYHVISEQQQSTHQFQESKRAIETFNLKIMSLKIRNWEFLAVAVTSLFMSIIFLEYNKKKILFTVVYVPMYLFTLLKTMVNTAIIFSFNILLYKKQK